MDGKIKKNLKLFFTNIFFFIIFIIVVELIFGYWFEKYNFGPYMREHRLKKIPYQMTYNNNNYKYNYVRNSLAFRGAELDPNNIKIIMVGGSTTDERYKPEELTIVGNLNKKLEKIGSTKKIINAGVEGQSTRGHIANFKFWFNKIEKFAPRYIIYYIGINDSTLLLSSHSDLQDGWIENPSKFESVLDNLKSRSIFSDLLRKVKHKYYNKKEEKRIIYDYDYSIKKMSEEKIYYTNYNNQLEKFDLEEMISKKKNIVNNYISNIDQLSDLTMKIGAKPIFINQPALKHENSEILFLLNYILIDHCNKKNYQCINLAKEIKATEDFWWDRVHTTPKGSKAIADAIFPKLINFLN